MAGKRIDHAALTANYQNPGDIYQDTNTEAAFGVIEQQVNDNWDDYDAHKKAATLDHPDGSVTTSKLADGVVTTPKIGNGVVTTDKMAAGAATDSITGSRTADPDTATAYGLTGTITQLFSWTFKFFKAITGKPNPFDSPSRTLEDLHTHIGSGGASHANAVAGGASGFMAGDDKTKLDGIAAGAEVNQNAFSKIVVSGQTDVDADSKTDTLNLVGGVGIAVTTDPATDTVTFTATGTSTPGPHAASHIPGGTDVIPNAVANGSAGLMSGADKANLDAAKATANEALGTANTAKATANAALPKAGGNVTGPLGLPSSGGATTFSAGTGDGASYATYNTKLALWWGLGIASYDDIIRAYFDSRVGKWDVKDGYYVDGTKMPPTRDNAGKLEFLSGGVWKPVGGVDPFAMTNYINNINIAQFSLGAGATYDMLTLNGKGILNEIAIIDFSAYDSYSLIIDGVEKQIMGANASSPTNSQGVIEGGSYTFSNVSGSSYSQIVKINAPIKFMTSLVIRLKNLNTAANSVTPRARVVAQMT